MFLYKYGVTASLKPLQLRLLTLLTVDDPNALKQFSDIERKIN